MAQPKHDTNANGKPSSVPDSAPALSAQVAPSDAPAAPASFTASSLTGKLCSRADVLQQVQCLPRPLVLTNGVFDVLHRGHVLYLEKARALGGSLVVALNTDASARRLGKGPDRPLNNEMDRAVVLAALASVSLVTWFDEDTPMELIGELKPDFLVKGGDYDMQKLAETRVVQAYGGQALAIAFVDGYSTTALVTRIRARQ